MLGDLIKTNSAVSHYYIISGTWSEEEKNLWLYPLPFPSFCGINMIPNPLDKTPETENGVDQKRSLNHVWSENILQEGNERRDEELTR